MTDTQLLLACQFPASADRMSGIRLRLREALEHTGLADSVMNDLLLAVGEACMNIMQHAYSERDQGDIVLEVEVRQMAGNTADSTVGRSNGTNSNGTNRNGTNRSGTGSLLVFRLTDFARHKSNVTEMRPRPLDEIRPGGLGCHIINQVMDEVVLLDRPGQDGNVLEMRKRL